MVRTAFLTQQGTGALSITLTSAKLRTWKLELFKYKEASVSVRHSKVRCQTLTIKQLY